MGTGPNDDEQTGKSGDSCRQSIFDLCVDIGPVELPSMNSGNQQ